MKQIMKIIIGILCIAVVGFAVSSALKSDYRKKHEGHGFDYMNGFSTTDFRGYHVYDGEKLAALDHAPEFMINDPDEMPVLDGAEACYPLYCAAAKALYQNIGEIEAGTSKEKCNGRIVQFTNTVYAYERLVDRENDIVFAARPSASQKEIAKSKIEQICTVPIAKEAFVFFVQKDNPIDNLTSEQIRAIYHGDITNWKEVGGKNEKILAYQRPEDSGSQVMMKYFMGDTELKEPETYEYIGGMGDVVRRVAQYADENGAMGYTFKYFLTGLQQEKNVKIISIDGIEPTAENIRNGSYPAVANVVMAYLASNENPNVQKMIDFMLSEDGQYLVEKTGYAPLGEKAEVRIENELPPLYVYTNENGQLTTAEETYILKWKGTEYRGWFSYYGNMMDDKNLCDRYSLSFRRDEEPYEIILQMNGNRLIVTGYLGGDKYATVVTVPPFDDLPEPGTEFILK